MVKAQHISSCCRAVAVVAREVEVGEDGTEVHGEEVVLVTGATSKLLLQDPVQ